MGLGAMSANKGRDKMINSMENRIFFKGFFLEVSNAHTFTFKC